MNTKRLFRSLAFASGLLAAQVGTAQAPAGAPVGATGLCNDGTYYTGATKQGACHGHKGVKEWYGAPANSEKAGPTGGTSEPAPASTRSTPPPAPPRSTSAATSKTDTMVPAPGGSADKVWLNTASNVYHCPGTKYYGTTKAGAYMTETEAKAKGAHADHGKPCK
jgi:hypothetical protein